MTLSGRRIYCDKIKSAAASIGAGTFLAPIQKTSDITYRIFDLDSFVVLIGIEGGCTVAAGSRSVSLQAGETLLLPATAERIAIRPHHTCKLLETYII